MPPLPCIVFIDIHLWWCMKLVTARGFLSLAVSWKFSTIFISELSLPIPNALSSLILLRLWLWCNSEYCLCDQFFYHLCRCCHVRHTWSLSNISSFSSEYTCDFSANFTYMVRMLESRHVAREEKVVCPIDWRFSLELGVGLLASLKSVGASHSGKGLLSEVLGVPSICFQPCTCNHLMQSYLRAHWFGGPVMGTLLVHIR